MTVVIDKYGRWGELSNWQLESRKEKQMDEAEFKEIMMNAGYTYNERYNEYFVTSDDKLKMTVVRAN